MSGALLDCLWSFPLASHFSRSFENPHFCCWDKRTVLIGILRMESEEVEEGTLASAICSTRAGSEVVPKVEHDGERI